MDRDEQTSQGDNVDETDVCGMNASMLEDEWGQFGKTIGHLNQMAGDGRFRPRLDGGDRTIRKRKLESEYIEALHGHLV